MLTADGDVVRERVGIIVWMCVPTDDGDRRAALLDRRPEEHVVHVRRIEAETVRGRDDDARRDERRRAVDRDVRLAAHGVAREADDRILVGRG